MVTFDRLGQIDLNVIHQQIDVSKHFDGRSHWSWKQRFKYTNPDFKVNGESTSSLFRHRDFFHRVTWRPRDMAKYVSPTHGKTSHLVVQASDEAWKDNTNTWRRCVISGNAPWLFRLSCWAVGNQPQHSRRNPLAGAFLAIIGKIILVMPVQAILLSFPMGEESGWSNFYYKPLLLRSWEYPLYAQNALDAQPGQYVESEDYKYGSIATAEDNRLLSPRKLVVLSEHGWTVQTDTVGIPYVFISYTRRHWSPDNPEHRQSLQKLAIFITQSAGLRAYWLDYRCIDPGPTMTKDVHSICDVVRAAQQVTVAVRSLDDTTLAVWGRRIWTLPEALICQNATIKFYAPNGSSIERSRIALSQTTWGFDQAARLLAEHFSGTLTLSRLQLIQEGLRALSQRHTSSQFSNGDIAYALMGLLNRRPPANARDNHFQALARMSLANDSDRVVERMICMLPPPRRDHTFQHLPASQTSTFESARKFALEDELNANLWDIEPICQVAGVCSGSGLLLDGCRGASIRWKNFPTVAYMKRASFKTKFLRCLLRSGGFLLFAGIFMCIIAFSFAHSFDIPNLDSNLNPQFDSTLSSHFESFPSSAPTSIPSILSQPYGALSNPTKRFALPLLVSGILFVLLGVGMIIASPWVILALYGGKVWRAAHWLIGIEGTLPIEQIEKLTFGNNTGRLRWAPSSSGLAWKDHHEHLGSEAPWISGQGPRPDLPYGHRLFTLIDTGSMTVHLFSAERPPTAAIVAGREGGMLRVLLCSYERSTNALTKETVLRMETPMLDKMRLLGWIKLA